MSRQFTKCAINIEAQLQHLLNRGLQIKDHNSAKFYLKHIGYYRLSGYMLPFQVGGRGNDRHTFKKGAEFDGILKTYIFDRKLRSILMDEIERVEVSLRSHLSNSLAEHYTPTWYANSALFNNQHWHKNFLRTVKEQIGHDNPNKRQVFIKHYYNNYNDPDMPPSWMVFEALSFGVISQIFQNLKREHAKLLCNDFNIRQDYLSSWLRSISYTRNTCAHHNRIWNRVFTIKPRIYKLYKNDLSPNDKLYAQAVIIKILLNRVAPENHFTNALANIFQEFPDIQVQDTGFPEGWENRPIWKKNIPPCSTIDNSGT